MAWPTSATVAAAGVITAAGRNALRSDVLALNGFVRKTADESVTSNAVLQNDDHLFITVPAAGTYEICVTLVAVSAANAAGDIRVGATFPAGTMTLFGDGLTQTLASGSEGVMVRFAPTMTSGVDPGLGYGLSTLATSIELKFLFVATASGTFQFQWAQSASNVNASTVKANSYLTMKQMA